VRVASERRKVIAKALSDLQNAAVVQRGSQRRILVVLQKTKIHEAGAGPAENVQGATRTRRRRSTPLANRDTLRAVCERNRRKRRRQIVDINRHRKPDGMDVDVAAGYR